MAAAKAESAATKVEVKAEVKPEIKPETKADIKPEIKPEADPPPPEPAVDVKPEANMATGSDAGGPVPLVGSSSFASEWRKVRSAGEQTRDLVRNKLQEAFDKGKEANEVYLRGIPVDTAALAEEAECKMIEVFGGTGKEYKTRFRSLQFNLNDPKNPEFIRGVIMGQRHIDDLATMEVRDMASDQVKKQREAAAENAKMALMDEKTYKQYAGKATEDGILKCPRCKSMKTEYVEVQTRSADEPTTKKCTCNACDYRWKFC